MDHLAYQVRKYWVPGSTIWTGGGDGFLAEIGLVPAGEIGGMRLGRHYCIALNADGSVLLQHAAEIRRFDIVPSGHVGGLAPRLRIVEPRVSERGRA